MTATSAVVDEGAVSPSETVVKKEPKRKWMSYIWDTFDKSPQERRLLFKLDTAILTFASLGGFPFFCALVCVDDAGLPLISSGYFIKYLDQININNAFVSGMYVSHYLFYSHSKFDVDNPQEGRPGLVQEPAEQHPDMLDRWLCHRRDPKHPAPDAYPPKILNSSNGGMECVLSCLIVHSGLTDLSSLSGLFSRFPCRDVTLLPTSTR